MGRAITRRGCIGTIHIVTIARNWRRRAARWVMACPRRLRRSRCIRTGWWWRWLLHDVEPGTGDGDAVRIAGHFHRGEQRSIRHDPDAPGAALSEPGARD